MHIIVVISYLLLVIPYVTSGYLYPWLLAILIYPGFIGLGWFCIFHIKSGTWSNQSANSLLDPDWSEQKRPSLALNYPWLSYFQFLDTITYFISLTSFIQWHILSYLMSVLHSHLISFIAGILLFLPTLITCCDTVEVKMYNIYFWDIPDVWLFIWLRVFQSVSPPAQLSWNITILCI